MRLVSSDFARCRHGFACVRATRAGNRHSRQARRAGLHQRHRCVVGHGRGRLRPRSARHGDADGDLSSAGRRRCRWTLRATIPTTGKRPGYGRFEIVPPPDRPLPPPAPTYYRSWSSGSASGPVTEYAPYYGPAGRRLRQQFTAIAGIRQNLRARKVPAVHRRVHEPVMNRKSSAGRASSLLYPPRRGQPLEASLSKECHVFPSGCRRGCRHVVQCRHDVDCVCRLLRLGLFRAGRLCRSGARRVRRLRRLRRSGAGRV